jgi:hypothetical protein
LESFQPLVDYLFSYYRDLDECIEWSAYQYPKRNAGWFGKPIYRHPIKVSTIGGLYVASQTNEGTRDYIDGEAATALTATELAHQERGHLVGGRRSEQGPAPGK